MYKAVAAAFTFSIALFGSSSTAHAQCRTGTVQCGSSYCSVIGNQCCASVGRPDISCPSGSYCTANGCADSSSGGDEGGCDSGFVECGEDYCSPVGRTCCASAGRPDLSCAAGSRCTASGCVSTSTGGGGTTGGDAGTGGGGSTGGGSGGGTCESGYVECGEYCSPVGNQCCASVGRSDISCRTGSRCTASGCVSNSTGGGSDAGTGPSTGGSGTTMVGDYTCSGQIVQSCSLRYCLSDDVESCYYEVKGQRFNCGSCTSTSDLMKCAQRAVDYCIGSGGGTGGSSAGSSGSSSGSSSKKPEVAGCSALGAGRDTATWWLLGLGALGIQSRRRRLS